MAWRPSPVAAARSTRSPTSTPAAPARSRPASTRTGPRVCVFEVSGTIRITTDLMIRNGNLTIAGQTAPSPGIMIRGAALRIQANDILDAAPARARGRRHERPGSGQPRFAEDRRQRRRSRSRTSSSTIARSAGPSTRSPASGAAHDNITFTNNIFAEPLNESMHLSDDGRTREKHGFGVLLGIEQERRPRHDGRQPVGAPGGAQPAGAFARARVREQPGLQPRQHGRGHADRLRPRRPRARSSATCSCAGRASTATPSPSTLRTSGTVRAGFRSAAST